MKQVRSYDLETGKIVWYGAGTTMNPIPSPVAADGMVDPHGGFPRQRPEGDPARGREGRHHEHAGARVDARSRHAVRAVAAALRRHPLPTEVEQRHPRRRSTPRPASLTISCTRLEAAPNIFASPVGAAGRVYFPSQDGTTVVLKHGPTFEVLAQNKLDDGFNASPALVDNELYLRGYKALYCVVEKN